MPTKWSWVRVPLQSLDGSLILQPGKETFAMQILPNMLKAIENAIYSVSGILYEKQFS